MKDIAFLKHKPLIEKFREMRSYDKKVKKAMSKKNKDLVEHLLTRKPAYTLDMLIPERYPTFIDALRDLDHCLTMVHPFAALPAIERESIQPERIHNNLYALTRYVDAKDRPSGTNDEESEHRLAQLQDQLPSNEPGALMNLVVNAAFVSEDDEETRDCKSLFQNKTFFFGREVPWSNERPLEKKELNAIIGAWFTLWRD
ncbi:pescadillo [Tanacetum coccineum]